MVTLMSLWLPILLSAVFVFIASSIIHMVLKYHQTDFSRLPAEDRVMESLRGAGIEPGTYAMPYAAGMAEMNTPEYAERRERGPVAFMTVLPSGPAKMTAELAQWFAFCIVVSVFAAYVASRALFVGANYLEVFRFTGTVAFVAYALSGWQQSIWFHQPWSTTGKSTFDGLIYALITAGTFGWLWP
jgi:hypothetical protein